MSARILPLVLSGGVGSRLWPISRALYPKQLLPMVGDRSMLAETLARVSEPERYAPPLVICNEEHRFLVGEQMRGAGAEPRGRILLEPAGRNTAPAACLGALVAAQEDPEQLLLLLPSDHFIADREAFQAAVTMALPAAEAGWLTAFGIAPESPETGYGYIQRGDPLPGLPGCSAARRFTEKPDAETAARYLTEGGYDWNSGMLLFRADILLAELERLQPDIVTACRAALVGAAPDLDFLRLDAEAFAAAPSISLDYAVLEKAARVAVVPAVLGWSDIGSWQGVWAIGERDEGGNSLRGAVFAEDCRGSYLRSDERPLAVIGVEDLVVVATDDAVLVCPRARSQEVGRLVERLKTEGRSEVAHHSRVYRPWGSYQSIDAGTAFQVKRLILKPGASISKQRHRHRSEHWVVVRGQAEVLRGEEVLILHPNESTYIPVGTLHRLHNPGEESLEIIEVQTGGYLGEDDIERFEDLYGRS